MEAQGDPFRRGLPTLQTSLTHPELPPCPRHLHSEDLFRLLEVAGIWGKFFCCFGRCGGVTGCGCRARFTGGVRQTVCGLFLADCAPVECGTYQTAPTENVVCRERPACRSVLVERYIPMKSTDLSPLISRLHNKLPAVFFPRGSLPYDVRTGQIGL